MSAKSCSEMAAKNDFEVIWFWANISITSSGISLDGQKLESKLLSGLDGFGDFLLARLGGIMRMKRKQNVNAT